MLAWIALTVISVGAFGILGIALGIFKLSTHVRSGLRAVAEAFSLVDDDEEEEDFVIDQLDDVGYEIDDETDEAFIKIANELRQLELEGDEIARREESA